MDQIKEILRQAIKYRFWIAVGISAILPMVAYFMGSGPIKAKADEQTKAVEGANSGVKPYASGTIPNRQYAPLVDTKKEELSKDINNSWDKLYQRQAPLLRWPESVEQDIRAWGTKWPENVDASLVRIAIIRYFTEYQDEITKAYQVFKPFDIMEGTGVVSAPPEEALMKPTKFKLDGQDIPSLGKVWASQERLWIQRALLEVIRDVNGEAESWDKAKIKQINLLDVGTTKSQDQVSMATGIQLVEAPSLDPPGAGGEEAAPAEDAGGEEMGPMGGMMMGGPQVDTDQVFYVQTESPQFKIMPFQISFLVDQQYIPDVLIGLENSPMAIQVSEFSMARPASRVIKPVKGENMNWGEMSMFGGGMMPGAPGSAGFGGMMPGMMMSMPGMMPGEMGMGGGGAAAVRKGVDARDKDRAKARKEAMEKMKKRMATTIHDPYFNIVELTVYGQARFYNAPPPPEAAEPSQAAEEGAEAADPNADPNATEMPKAEDASATPTPKAEGDAAPQPDATTPAPEPTPGTDAAAKPEPSPAPDAETSKGAETPAKDEPAKPDAGETPAKDEPAEAPKAQ